MDADAWKTRKCPACSSNDYAFRSRKKLVSKEAQSEAIETKFRCKACQHEWKERSPGDSAG
jgi:transposase-like protein